MEHGERGSAALVLRCDPRTSSVLLAGTQAAFPGGRYVGTRLGTRAWDELPDPRSVIVELVTCKQKDKTLHASQVSSIVQSWAAVLCCLGEGLSACGFLAHLACYLHR